MINIKHIFQRPTLRSVVENELYEAERQLLKNEANEAYYRHMAHYHRERVTKLKARQQAVESASRAL